MKARIAIPRLLAITLLSMAAVTLLCMAAAKHGRPVPAPGVQQMTPGQKQPGVQLSGEKARDYLEQPGDGQSLMAAVTAARFGLAQQEQAPFAGANGGGYLGMSHEQNLNAWFDEEGVTLRPTVSVEEQARAWQLAFRLKAYGYGSELVAVPPIVSRQVKGNRIEYQRSNNAFPVEAAVPAAPPSDLQAFPVEAAVPAAQPPSDLQATRLPLQLQRDAAPRIVEWYENRAEGIEQGFTLNERPRRSDGVIPDQPLRVLLAVTGDLRARLTVAGEAVELLDKEGKGALSYSKLIAQDADGKKLAARIEASADGREIALVVDDQDAAYPIVIDPIVASLEKKLEAFTAQQAEARFGTAVAIEGDRAVVGAWREDTLSGNNTLFDPGVVYVFTRSGTTWTLTSRNDSGNFANDACGQSVAISGSRVVYGCPGAFNNTGRAFMRDLTTSVLTELNPAAGQRATGDRYGASVAISGNKAVVGAPSAALDGKTNVGVVFNFTADSNSNFTYNGASGPASAVQGALFGSSVAIDGGVADTTLIGVPGANQVVINSPRSTLQPSDGATGDQFGQSVAISGNTAVVGALFNSNANGTNAGAAYVFVRDTSGNWSQQQKLTASNGRMNDFFSTSAVAIQGNTIVVGAYAWDGGTPPFIFKDDDRGAAYVFTRSDTVWTEQTRILANDGERSDQFGIGVGISGNSVIAGARAATASGVARAGAAYVYRLDCTPPYNSVALIQVSVVPPGYTDNLTACSGTNILFVGDDDSSGSSSKSYQWRKNGMNIAGATQSRYDISSANPSDAGSYDVIITNACGSEISRPATLNIHTFSLNPTSQNFGVSGSTGIVNVTAAGSTCSWEAVSNSSFITVNSGASGTGNGTVGFTVAANPNSGQRTGTITIAGLTFTVSQDGTNCSYSIAPTSQTLGANASTNTVNVTAGAGCTWTATSNDPSFLSINSGASGTGNGSVTYTIAANSATAQRTGTLTIAGQTFNISQAGITPTPTATPKIALEQPAGTVLANNTSTVGFGKVAIGARTTRTFTLRNKGTAALTGIALTTGGANSSDFVRHPAGPSSTLAPGASTTFRITFQPGKPTGRKNAVLHLASNDANKSPFNVTLRGTSERARPAISTTASTATPLGGAISDRATLAGGANPTGSITFKIFGPNTPNCGTAPVFTSSKPVSGNGTYSSGPFTPAAAGTYRFVASYSGDSNNQSVSGNCQDAGESVLVTAPTPTSTPPSAVAPSATAL